MTCHAPGTAWQPRWSRPLGSKPSSAAWAKTTPANNMDVFSSTSRDAGVSYGPPQVVSGDGGTSNVVDVYVGYLRQKLEAEGQPRLLHTLRGVGYVMRAD